MDSMLKKLGMVIRNAKESDVPAVLVLESDSFQSDRFGKRSFLRAIKSEQSVFKVLYHQKNLVGYGIIHLHKGTKLARLYSVAISKAYQSRGIARILITQLEKSATNNQKHFMRLEVAQSNIPALKLYESMGYKGFGELLDYYENHETAIRMQKRIRFPGPKAQMIHAIWYQQSTSFTCGAASMLMAFSAIDSNWDASLNEELDIWREANTIFMTTGHGGSHPIGLALAAKRRGFDPEVYISVKGPLFVDGVRSFAKKEIVRTVDLRFKEQAQEMGIVIHYREPTLAKIKQFLLKGNPILALISTYRISGHKAPHWVLLTGVDEQCFYFHDPDPNELTQSEFDCMHMPLAHEDFEKLNTYGQVKLRTIIVLKKALP